MIKIGMERIISQGRIWLQSAYFKMREISAEEFTSEPGTQPTTPPDGELYFYAKQSASADVSALWWKDDLGVEHEIGGSGTSGGVSGPGSAWSCLTNGDPVTPELVWDSNGDVIMTEICNGASCS